MAESDIAKQKQEREGERTANVAHIVTPDPSETLKGPKLAVRRGKTVGSTSDDKDAKKEKDQGPLQMGVNFDSSEY